ncbi:uncharacterized protein LOC111130551 [Crassostrea virginica]
MSAKRKFIEDVDEAVKKKQCMYILNDQQMLHLLSEKESRLIEKMDVLSGNFGSEGESQKQVECSRGIFPINSYPLQGLNNNSSSNNNNLSQQQCARCLAGEPGHFRHVNS